MQDSQGAADRYFGRLSWHVSFGQIPRQLPCYTCVTSLVFVNVTVISLLAHGTIMHDPSKYCDEVLSHLPYSSKLRSAAYSNLAIHFRGSWLARLFLVDFARPDIRGCWTSDYTSNILLHSLQVFIFYQDSLKSVRFSAWKFSTGTKLIGCTLGELDQTICMRINLSSGLVIIISVVITFICNAPTTMHRHRYDFNINWVYDCIIWDSICCVKGCFCIISFICLGFAVLSRIYRGS